MTPSISRHNSPERINRAKCSITIVYLRMYIYCLWALLHCVLINVLLNVNTDMFCFMYILQLLIFSLFSNMKTFRNSLFMIYNLECISSVFHFTGTSNVLHWSCNQLWQYSRQTIFSLLRTVLVCLSKQNILPSKLIWHLRLLVECISFNVSHYFFRLWHAIILFH